MSVSMKSNTKDETRIGEFAAKQPLSGVSVVNKLSIKGSTVTAFVRLEETKKST